MTDTSVQGQKMTPSQRYDLLHREAILKAKKERYDNRPDVIAKREERERKKAEKEAEKEAKRIEKANIRQEKINLALATKQTKKINTLEGALIETSPA